ncbi:MAG: DnaA/Hda family protein [Ignavibacteria bacterium]
MINNLSASFDDSSDLNKNNSGENEGNSESRINAVSVWSKFIELLSDNLKTNEVNTWFSVIAPKHLENNVLTITVPSEDYYSLIESRYNKIISKIVETLLGPEGKLNYEISQMGLFSNNDTAVQKEHPAQQTGKNTSLINISDDNKFIENIKLTESDPEEELNSNLNQKHIFDNFIKGESNELAVAAAYAITNNPGKIYNPFFVYGGVGLGKTHLVQAIGNEIQKKFPEKKYTIPQLLTLLLSLLPTLLRAG